MRDTQSQSSCNEARNCGVRCCKNTPYGYINGVGFDNNMSYSDRIAVLRHYKLIVEDDHN